MTDIDKTSATMKKRDSKLLIRNLRKMSEQKEQAQALSLQNVGNCADIEEPYFDEKGREIKEFAVLKVYHFFGVNEQGRGRKHYYMYKWVRLKEHKGKKYWVAMHLTNDIETSYYNLRAVADRQTRIIKGTEIIAMRS